MSEKTKINLAIVSTYPPTECGIATYTKSIASIIEDFYLKNKIKIVAIDSTNNKYDDEVMGIISKDNPTSYIKAAEKINKSSVSVVNLQHEYGMFGGKDGKNIIYFLKNLKKPVVTTMHSVLTLHSSHRYNLTKKIIDLSQSIIVMTQRSKNILIDHFKLNNKKIYFIPHGGPNIRPESKILSKQQFGLKNNVILSTFGHINPGKGIEYAITSLKKVIKSHPEVMYLIIGATHPDIKKRDGESYRDKLKNMVKKYNLSKNVRFINKYLDYRELVNYLKATDIYLAPQLDLHQAVSGTVAYAICCDNAVISSPTEYAKEVLDDGRGIVVKEKNSDELTKAILFLLDNQAKLEDIKFKAYLYARNMIFPRVGLEHLKVFEIESYRKPEDRYENQIIKFKFIPTLRYIHSMTTKLGIVQHAKLDIPDLRFGYSIDDQARALIAVAKYCTLFQKNTRFKNLLHIYLNFISKASQKNKFFHNFMDREGNFIDQEGSEDSYGRTMWSLGYIARNNELPKYICQKAKKLFYANLHLAKRLTYIRAKSYLILGLYYLKESDWVEKIADSIVKMYNDHLLDGWKWFEDKMVFANAIIPYALLRSYKLTKKNIYLKIAMESFDFLDSVCRKDNVPSPIGQNGWYKRGGKRAWFDQQAIDVADMVLCASEIVSITNDQKYHSKACEWFMWFHGNNVHKLSLYDYATGGCYDGITKKGINLNEGAESVLVYLLAHLKIKNINKKYEKD